MPSVAVVILNWNGEKHLNTFLPSVVRYSTGAKIYVVDNASTDASIGFLKTFYPDITRICHTQNEGFCEGYNKALKQITADYYILLNNDVAVTEHWLEPLITAMEHDPNLAVCQPKLLSYTSKYQFEYAGAAGGYLDVFGYPFCRGRIFSTLETDHGQYAEQASVTWATGAAFCVRSSLYHQLGGLDARFFAHMEEIDFCCRAIQSGYSIAYIPTSSVFHLGAGTLAKESPQKTYLNYRNGLFLLHKNYTGKYFLVVLWFRLVLDGISGFRFLAKGKIRNIMAIIQAHVAYYKAFTTLERPNKQTLKQSVPFTRYSIIWQYYILKKRLYKDLPNT